MVCHTDETRHPSYELGHSQNPTHSTSNYDLNYKDNEYSSFSEHKKIFRLRQENEILLEMLREQITANAGQEPAKEGLPNRFYMSSTRDEVIPDEV